MKVKYKGFILEAKRERCLAGYPLLYYSAVREEDGYEVICSFEDSAETVRDKIKQIKEEIDDYIEHPEDWEDDFDN